MARNLQQILVIDVESTCWEGAPPPGQISEIIEIGLCPIDANTLQRQEKRSILVRPEKSRVSPFCTDLTTLTAEMLQPAGSFRDAVRILKKEYDSQNCLWASWGDYDRRQFEKVCREFKIGYPFGPAHLNIKTLYAVAIGAQRERGLDRAYEELGLIMEGTHHRGHDDAWNIGALLLSLLRPFREPTG